MDTELPRDQHQQSEELPESIATQPYSIWCWPPWGCLGTVAGSFLATAACGLLETLCIAGPSPYRLLNCCGVCLSPIPPTAVVTGGNRGLGFHVARILAQRGYHVILACRDSAAGTRAASRLGACGANVECIRCDLADYASIVQFAAVIRARGIKLSVLVNNAGVISADAVRVNHLGHFALSL